MKVRRPVVRSFRVAWAERAARWVRAGGHAVVWETASRARLYVPPIDLADETDLGLWAILDLGLARPSVERAGPMRGLSFVRVPPHARDVVRARAERDSGLAGPTRVVTLDCLACAACCVENEVVLTARDVTRLRRAGREALARRPWTRRRSDGKLVLVLTRDRRCKQLGPGNRCAIYDARPEGCRAFPAGSECCLFAREDTHGWIDGA